MLDVLDVGQGQSAVDRAGVGKQGAERGTRASGRVKKGRKGSKIQRTGYMACMGVHGNTIRLGSLIIYFIYYLVIGSRQAANRRPTTQQRRQRSRQAGSPGLEVCEQ